MCKNLINISDLTKEDFNQIIKFSKQLSSNNKPLLKGKISVSYLKKTPLEQDYLSKLV